MAMAMGIVGCAWDARTTMGTSGWSVLPYHQEATQLSSRRCRCLMLCTRICVSKAGQWKVTITITTWEAAWPIRPTESGAGSSVLNSMLAFPCSPASQEATEALIATDMLSHAGCFSSLHPDRSRPAPLLPFDRELPVARATVGTSTLRLSRPRDESGLGAGRCHHGGGPREGGARHPPGRERPWLVRRASPEQ